MGVSIHQHADDRPNCLTPWATHRASMTSLTARVSPAVTLHFASRKISPTPTDCAGLSSPRRIQKYASCRGLPKSSVFFVRNITVERSRGTGEAERVRWVYEWGGGSQSGAKDATVSFIARMADYQPPTVQGTTRCCGMTIRQPSR